MSSPTKNESNGIATAATSSERDASPYSNVPPPRLPPPAATATAAEAGGGGDGDSESKVSNLTEDPMLLARSYTDVPLTSANTTTTTFMGRASSTIGSVLYAPVGYLMGSSSAGVGFVDEEEEEEDNLREFMDADMSGRDVFMPTPRRKDDDEVIDFLLDDKRDMTWSRRIALAQMHRTWYYPRAQQEQAETEQELDEQLKIHKASSSFLSPPTRLTTTTTPTESNKNKEVEHRPPKETKQEKPSLAKAWAYFEHFSLPRYIHLPEHDRHDLKRAEPGEAQVPTKLYDPLFTPLSQMGDFGLGIGLYFSTLRAITILTFMAGLLNIPNFIYFSSNDYSDGQPGVPSLIQGSAICTRQEWVPCTDTNCDASNFRGVSNRLGRVERLGGGGGGDGDDSSSSFMVALKNDCVGATREQGLVNYATMVLILLGILIMNWYQKRKEIEFDEDEQTAQDYSVRILNPPPDATDPDEWRDFFRNNFDGAHATSITVALDNDFLVRALVERREAMKKIELYVDPGTSLDTLTLARLGAEVEQKRTALQRLIAIVSPGVPELFGRIAELEAKIKGWAQVEYPVSNVFVTFEKEADQRKVLSALNMGSLNVMRNNVSALPHPKYAFRRGKMKNASGKQIMVDDDDDVEDENEKTYPADLVLKVKEPDEPSTVRWADLNVRFKDKMKPLLTTTLASILTIVLIALLISVIHNRSALFGAISIAVFNALFPQVAKVLTSFERHSSEGLKQTSLYFKIAVFRWVNTAIVITIITPFSRTTDLNDGLIPSIYAIFFAELVTTNAIQLADVTGHLKKHFLAPRAPTQDLMNLNMSGEVWELAERYTNMTKIFFLSVWYCSIYPGALFMCSFVLFVNYFTDRFSLMRTWRRVGALGTRISKFSRRYFFSTAIVAMAIISSYFWSGFPFDNLCANDGSNSALYAGTWNVTRVGSDANVNPEEQSDLLATNVVIHADEPTYRYCLQDLIRTPGRSFPASPELQPEGDEWMTEDQEMVTTVYGLSSVVVMGLVALSFLWAILSWVKGLFKGKYKPKGDDQDLHFSKVDTISTYIPQVESFVFSHPLLACSHEGINPELFDWSDPDRPYSYYDLTLDAKDLLEGLPIDFSKRNVFSVVSYEPPPEE